MATATALPSDQFKVDGKYQCPECPRTFTHPQGLGAHRFRKHGIVGAQHTVRKGDGYHVVIHTLFPDGIPTDDPAKFDDALSVVELLRDRLAS